MRTHRREHQVTGSNLGWSGLWGKAYHESPGVFIKTQDGAQKIIKMLSLCQAMDQNGVSNPRDGRFERILLIRASNSRFEKIPLRSGIIGR